MGQKLAEAWVEVRGDDTKLPADLNNSTRAVEKWAQGLNTHIDSILGSWMRYLAIGSLVARAHHEIAKSMADIDATAKLSDRLGVTTEKLTGLRYAAALAGVESHKFTSQMQFLARSLAALASRGGQASAFLQAYGIDVASLSKVGVDEAFLKIADAISKIADPMQRARVATMLFGRNAGEMTTLMMQGRGAIEAAAKEAEKLGIAYSRVDAARIEAANDAWTKMGAAIRGVVDRITIEMAPVIEELADELNRITTGLDHDRDKRSKSQQAMIDDAKSQSFVMGLFVQNDVDRRNKEFAWLQQLQSNRKYLTPEEINSANAKPNAVSGQEAVAKQAQAADAMKRQAEVAELWRKFWTDQQLGQNGISFEQSAAIIRRIADPVEQASRWQELLTKRRKDAEQAAEDAKRSAEERSRTASSLVERYRSPIDKLRDEMGTLAAHQDLLSPAQKQATLAGMFLRMLGTSGAKESGLFGEFGTMMAGMGVSAGDIADDVARATPIARPKGGAGRERRAGDFLEAGMMGFADVNRRMQEALAHETFSAGEKEMMKAMKEAETTRKEQLKAMREVDRAIREARMPIPVAS